MIEAIATDAVGNEGRHTISITFQPVVAGPRIAIASGNGQAEQVNQALAQPLAVTVKDEFGNAVAGRVVRFEVTRNSGTLKVNPSGAGKRVLQVPTDGSGRAAAFLTLGDTAGEGNNRVRATAVGVAGEVEFCASALPAAADKILMVMGDNQRGVVGHPLATPLEALVVDKDGNAVQGIAVTFSVVEGNGNLDGQQSLVRATSVDGIARTVLTLGPDPGINNNVVNATFPGLTRLPATYVASGLLPGDPADTRLSGVVLDNAHTPIPGALVTIPGTTLSATTDDEGQFLLVQVPVGHIHLRIDPSNSPRPETFPPLEFETVTVAGQVNTIGQPILIPALATQNAQLVGGNQDVTLGMPGVAGLELTVFANSVTCPDGSSQCQVTISQVHLDKVPMPPPNGTIFMPPAWTVQPAGVVFDPPARISIPNDGLPIGRVIDIFQFDHALNEFISVGKGTVSEDGSVIVSDPGFGITRAGWGGGGPPPPDQTCGNNPPPCKICDPPTRQFVDDPEKNRPPGAFCEDEDRIFPVTCAGRTIAVSISSNCSGRCTGGKCLPKPWGIGFIKRNITEALNRICNTSCVADTNLGADGKGLRTRIRDNLARDGYRIECVDELPVNAGSCAEAEIGGHKAFIAKRTVTPGEQCSQIGPDSTLLHEIVHGPGDTSGEAASVGCETSCFKERGTVTRGVVRGEISNCR